MEKLSEHDVARSYIEKNVDMERLLDVFFEPDDDEYYVACPYFRDELNKIFRITDALETKWLFNHIDFSVKVSLENGKIKKCKLSKYTEVYGYVCNGRLQEHWEEALPLQQEIRVFKRIMDYITIIPKN
jgi:hypothetical protein